MLTSYKHSAASIEETPEKRFASLDIKNKINSLKDSLVDEYNFDREIVIPNTKYGQIMDFKIEGRSLINLAHGLAWQGSVYNPTDNTVSLECISNSYRHANTYGDYKGYHFFSKAVTLTISFEVISLPTSNVTDMGFVFTDGNGAYDKRNGILINGLGKYHKTITLLFTPDTILAPRLYANCQNLTVSGSVTIKDLCIIEGEVSSDIYDDYIASHSVGETSSSTITLTSTNGEIVNTAKITLTEPLRGIPNGAKDSIELIDGKYKCIRRCGKYVIQGNAFSTSTTSGGISMYDGLIEGMKNNRCKLLSNVASFKPEELPNRSIPGIFTSQGADGTRSRLYIDLDTRIFLTSPPTVDEVRTWLDTNKFTLFYELMDYSIEDVEGGESINNLMLFDGQITISSTTRVCPTCTFKAPKNMATQLQSTIQTIEVLEKEVFEMEKGGLTAVLTIIDRKDGVSDDI